LIGWQKKLPDAGEHFLIIVDVNPDLPGSITVILFH
jgi:hypothetical protein